MSQAPFKLVSLAVQPLRKVPTSTSYSNICRACRARLSTRTSFSSRRHDRTSLHKAPSRRETTLLNSRKHFSSTSPKPATVVLQNPRTDDEGKDMTIIISERAAKRLRQITSSAPSKNTLSSSSASLSQDAHLRVTVTSGGCHGFQYLMALEDASKVDQEEDTIFEYAQQPDGSDTGNKGKAEVVMDSASLELLKGSTIDFTQELIGSQFKIVGNPRATSSCGCGTSFDIE